MSPVGASAHAVVASGATASGPVSRTTPSFGSAGTGAAQALDSDDVVVTIPGSTGQYLLLLFLIRDSGAGAAISNQATIIAAGWEEVRGKAQGGTANAWVFGKFHDGSEPSVPFNWGGTTPT